MKRCALLILVVLAALSACTPKEIETSQKAGEICALGGPYRDSDGNQWSSQNCASHSRVCLAPRPVEVRRPTRWCGTTIEPTVTTTTVTSTTVPTSLPAPYVDPCDPAILDLPWSEDAPFAGWLPPACDDVERIDGVRTFPVPTITQEDQ